MDPRGWAKVVREAKLQAGVISMAQLSGLGLSKDAVRWRVKRLDLNRVYNGVYRLAAAKQTWEQRACAALLRYGPDAALAVESAAHVWCVDGFKREPSPITVAVPEDQGRAGLDEQGILVRTVARPFLPVRFRFLRITELHRTLTDLAPTLSDDALDDAIDSAQRMWPDTDRLLLEEVGGDARGIPGAARLRALLEDRGGLCTDSTLENRVFRALRRTTLPRPRHQLHVFDAQGYVVRLDFAWPQQRVALHVDSYLHHSARSRFEHDRSFMNRLSALGWHSMFVTSRSLDTDAWLFALSSVLKEREPQLAFTLRSEGTTAAS